MNAERLQEIYQNVVHRGFYSVGREAFLSTDITHSEMVELVKLACQNGVPSAQAPTQP
jgi:hypothetical protein